MALKVRYTVVDGEVMAEKRDGVRRFYVPDPLGSTVALLDSSQTKTDTFTYWPYGEERTRTGSTPTPFRFVGTQGYYRDTAARTYIRARHYRQDQTRWLTQDPIGFDGGDANLYRYALDRPISGVDPSGMIAWVPIIIGGAAICGGIWLYRTIRCRNCLQNIFNELIGPNPRAPSPWWQQNVPQLNGWQWSAFRHCFGSCLAVRRCGGGCASFADYRESPRTRYGIRDRYNNEIGRRFGGGKGDCFTQCMQAVNDGRLIVNPDEDPRTRDEPRV